MLLLFTHFEPVFDKDNAIVFQKRFESRDEAKEIIEGAGEKLQPEE